MGENLRGVRMLSPITGCPALGINSSAPGLAWPGTRRQARIRRGLFSSGRDEPGSALAPSLGLALNPFRGRGGPLGGGLQSLFLFYGRHALPLFTSLLNTVCAYDPVGYGIPYNHLLFSDYREPLVEEAAQVLIVTLDHDSATSASPTVDGTTTGTAMDDADVRMGAAGRAARPAGLWALSLAELGKGYPAGTSW